MDSVQIARVLCTHPRARKHFIGIFAINTLPPLPLSKSAYPICLIFNTDTDTMSGSHWLALYMPTKDQCEYFDSYGVEPCLGPVKKYLHENFKNVSYNKLALQAQGTKTCGEFCICFIIALCQNYSMRQFQILLTHYLPYTTPDELVHSYVYNYDGVYI